MQGVIETAELAVVTAKALVKLFDCDKQNIQGLGRSAGSALRVHEALQLQPLITVADASRSTGLTQSPVSQSPKDLERLGIEREITGKKRNRVDS